MNLIKNLLLLVGSWLVREFFGMVGMLSILRVVWERLGYEFVIICGIVFRIYVFIFGKFIGKGLEMNI